MSSEFKAQRGTAGPTSRVAISPIEAGQLSGFINFIITSAPFGGPLTKCKPFAWAATSVADPPGAAANDVATYTPALHAIVSAESTVTIFSGVTQSMFIAPFESAATVAVAMIP